MLAKDFATLIFSMLVAVLAYFPTKAQASDTAADSTFDPVIFWGQGYSFSLTACDNWRVEETGEEFGRIAHIVPSKDSTGSVPAYMYIIVDPKPHPETVIFDSAVVYSLSNFHKDFPDVTILQDSSIVTARGRKALVFNFVRPVGGLREAWAMLDADSVIIRIGYVARQKEDYSVYLKTFLRTVQSYIYLGFAIRDERLAPPDSSTNR